MSGPLERDDSIWVIKAVKGPVVLYVGIANIPSKQDKDIGTL